ncbi:MAG TPA: hypothetical protein VN969_42660 [Streptosporangiaceae bacterium]|nr:hypothetical protein [Streptosporangiaceae bacterium]
MTDRLASSVFPDKSAQLRRRDSTGLLLLLLLLLGGDRLFGRRDVIR